jgi:hypothetical protein
VRNDDAEDTVVIEGQRGRIVLRNAAAEDTVVMDGDTGDIILRNADCAEEFDIDPTETVDPGTVLILGPDGLRPCNEAYDKKVVGVMSGAGQFRPGIVLDRGLMATSCRSPVGGLQGYRRARRHRARYLITMDVQLAMKAAVNRRSGPFSARPATARRGESDPRPRGAPVTIVRVGLLSGQARERNRRSILSSGLTQRNLGEPPRTVNFPQFSVLFDVSPITGRPPPQAEARNLGLRLLTGVVRKWGVLAVHAAPTLERGSAFWGGDRPLQHAGDIHNAAVRCHRQRGH